MSLLNILLQATANLGALSAPIGAGIVILGAGFGIGKVGASALEAIARQPEVAGDARTFMLISAALIEGTSLFALVICLMAMG
jgi:F-type H+-transporting ATPase subunit c